MTTSTPSTEQRRALGVTAGDFRADFRSSGRGTLKCVPPNRRCGGRCIPPEWDCRLKGEGDDPHLKAAGKGSDPIAGFANLERGFSRLGKGVAKLSFSEIEGGRRALARGSAKLSPGDLKQKKELQEKVYKFGLLVGAPVTLAIFAGLSHRGLKAFPAYRRGVGAQVDDAVGGAIRQVQRNTPFVGQELRNREAVGPEAIRSLGRFQRNVQAGNPSAISRRALTGSGLTRASRLTTSGAGTSQTNGYNAIETSLKSIDLDINSREASKRGFTEWEDASLKAYWNTPEPATDYSPDWIKGRTKPSVFSVPSTTKMLADSMGYTPRTGRISTQANEVANQLATRLRATGEGIATSMRTRGLNPSDPVAVDQFVRSVPLDRPLTEPGVKEAFYQRLVEATTNKDHVRQAHNIFSQTTLGFDSMFGQVASSVTQRPDIRSIPRNRDGSSRRVSEYYSTNFYRDGSRAWTETLADRLNFPEQIRRTGAVQGPATGTLVRKAYHATRVMKKQGKLRAASVVLTRTEALTAGSEIAEALSARGNFIKTPTTADEALQVLNNYYGGDSDNNIGRITLVQSPTTTRARTPAVANPSRPPADARPARRRSRAQRLNDLLRQKVRGEDGQLRPRFASREAAEAYLKRLEQGRTDAALRRDFTPQDQRLGKPCGSGFIPKSRKCSKPTSKGYVQPPQGYRGGFVSKKRKTPHEVSGETVKNVAKIAAGATALAVGGRLAYRNRAKIRAGALTVRKEALKFSKSKNKGKFIRVRAQRVARDASRASSLVPFAAIRGLSSKQVIEGINKLPTEFQAPARKLLGDAKKGAAYLQLNAQGYKTSLIDIDNNYSVWTNKQGNIRILSSVDDALINFNVSKVTKGNLMKDANIPTYNIDFLIDQNFNQREGLDRGQGLKVLRNINSMFNTSMDRLPKEAVLLNSPWKGDTKGDARTKIYKKVGFNDIEDLRDTDTGESTMQWALVRDGKVQKMSPEEAESMFEELLNTDFDDLIDEDKIEFDSLDSKHARIRRYKRLARHRIRKLVVSAA